MMAYRAALFAAAALALGAAGAAAQTSAPTAAPSPRPLPAGLTRSGNTVMMQPIGDSAGDDATDAASPTPDRRPSLLHALSPADHDLFEKAFDAADRGDWTAARGLADQGRDAIARRLVVWRYLCDRNSGAGFDEIAAFLRDHPEWPLRDVLFARAEHAMPDTMAPGAVIAWFGGRKPETGIGAVRLGEALIASGQREEGRAMIRKAWIEGNFEPAEELAIVKRHGDILTPEIDRQRLDHLIWRGDLSAARRELSRVDNQAQRVAEVRMALRTNPRAGARMISSLPDALRRDPGLIFDEARNLRRHGDDDAVPALLVKAPTSTMARIDPRHWWGELARAARQAMKDGQYRIAYHLVSDTGLDEGADFAEAEFMAGWIALRFLHETGAALDHFRRLATGVSRPISLARAYYWTARAYEAKGEDAQAARQYRLAADNPETFYGQLALTRLEPDPRLRLKETPAAVTAARKDYDSDGLARALRVLADLGSERLLRLFAVHDVEIHPDAGHVALLAGDLVRMGFQDVAVRVAKEASYNGIDLQAYSHPVIALPSYPGPGAAPEGALVLGLIRQETEFNTDAVSRVGARGIMQLMPATARQMARLAGLPYRHAELITDPHYNMQLGMTELSTDLADWGDSYILAAAAYNAGPANVKRWIAAYGDPRSQGVDPIDWIEQIPFSETRNYVQRVIENTEVYRSRLAGRSAPLEILADLYRPNPPPPEPVLPPPPEVPTPQPRPEHASDASTAPQTSETAFLDPAREPADVIPRPSARPARIVAPKQKPAQ